MYRRYRIERTKSRHLFLEPLQGPPGTKINDQLDVPGEVMVPEADVAEYLDGAFAASDATIERVKAERDQTRSHVRHYADLYEALASAVRVEHRQAIGKLHNTLTQIMASVRVDELPRLEPWERF